MLNTFRILVGPTCQMGSFWSLKLFSSLNRELLQFAKCPPRPSTWPATTKCENVETAVAQTWTPIWKTWRATCCTTWRWAPIRISRKCLETSRWFKEMAIPNETHWRDLFIIFAVCLHGRNPASNGGVCLLHHERDRLQDSGRDHVEEYFKALP